jgi:hypothetical protein
VRFSVEVIRRQRRRFWSQRDTVNVSKAIQSRARLRARLQGRSGIPWAELPFASVLRLCGYASRRLENRQTRFA